MINKPSFIIHQLSFMLLAVGVVGCAFTGKEDSTKFKVIAVSSRDVAALSSNDVVRIMRRAGFTDEQILEFGTQVRNALLENGAAEIKLGKAVEAIFAVNRNKIFITARLRGNFIYDVEKGSWIGLEAMPPATGGSKRKEAPLGTFPDKNPKPIFPATPDTQYPSESLFQR
jgi:hypothetical protein